MNFTFDPSFDYYPLFEACMADGTTEDILNDPEDYNEFIDTLKNGLWAPEDWWQLPSIQQQTNDNRRHQSSPDWVSIP